MLKIICIKIWYWFEPSSKSLNTIFNLALDVTSEISLQIDVVFLGNLIKSKHFDNLGEDEEPEILQKACTALVNLEGHPAYLIQLTIWPDVDI